MSRSMPNIDKKFIEKIFYRYTIHKFDRYTIHKFCMIRYLYQCIAWLKINIVYPAKIQRHSINLPSESLKVIYLTNSLSTSIFDNVVQYSVSSRRLLLLVKMIIIFADRANASRLSPEGCFIFFNCSERWEVNNRYKKVGNWRSCSLSNVWPVIVIRILSISWRLMNSVTPLLKSTHIMLFFSKKLLKRLIFNFFVT